MIIIGDPIKYNNKENIPVVGIYLGTDKDKVSILTPDGYVIEIPEYLETSSILKEKSISPLSVKWGDVIHKTYKSVGSMRIFLWINYDEFTDGQKAEIMKYLDEIVERFVDGTVE